MTRIGQFSKDFKSARQSAGLSQAEIATALGVEQATISRWERGAEPTIENLALIGKFFREVSVDFPYLQSILTDMVSGEIRRHRGFVPVIGQLGSFGIVKKLKDDSTRDLAIPFEKTEKTRSVLVATTDHNPYISEGSVLYFEEPEPGSFAPEGRLAFARGEGSDMYVGEIYRGSHETMFTVRTPTLVTPGVFLKSSSTISAVLIR